MMSSMGRQIMSSIKLQITSLGASQAPDDEQIMNSIEVLILSSMAWLPTSRATDNTISRDGRSAGVVNFGVPAYSRSKPPQSSTEGDSNFPRVILG